MRAWRHERRGADLAAWWPKSGLEEEDHPMTIEILYLTAQIQRWLNERIARHLAARAAKLDH
jgi:hypothetical protein